MKQALRIVAASVVAGALVSAVAAAQSTAIDKSYMGTWKLNVAKSKYENANPPREARAFTRIAATGSFWSFRTA